MKNFCIAALLVLSAGFCLGQAPKPAVSIPNIDLYGGYVATFPDYGPSLDSYRFNGFEGQFSKGFTPHIWLTGTADIVFGNVNALNANVTQFTGTVGGKYNILTGKLRPYAIAQIGYVRQSSSGPHGGLYAGDHHPPLAPNVTDIEDGLAYRLGLGGDLQMSQHIYWRMIQWDVQPMPFARHTPFYENFSAGVGYRF